MWHIYFMAWVQCWLHDTFAPCWQDCGHWLMSRSWRHRFTSQLAEASRTAWGSCCSAAQMLTKHLAAPLRCTRLVKTANQSVPNSCWCTVPMPMLSQRTAFCLCMFVQALNPLSKWNPVKLCKGIFIPHLVQSLLSTSTWTCILVAARLYKSKQNPWVYLPEQKVYLLQSKHSVVSVISSFRSYIFQEQEVKLQVTVKYIKFGTAAAPSCKFCCNINSWQKA